MEVSLERWYALFAKPRAEQRVAQALAARGVDAWVPELAYHGKSGNLLFRPFFPRYLFARFDWERSGVVNIQWTPGLSRVVTFDGRPAWLDDGRMAHLQRTLDVLDGDEFLALKAGERVRITQGPFQDVEAIFHRRLNGRQRIAVLLDILGRTTQVVLHESDIERIA